MDEREPTSDRDAIVPILSAHSTVDALRQTIEAAFPKLWAPTEAALATILAMLPDDVVNPPTVIFTGPASGGKTTVLEFVAEIDEITYRSDRFTPRAFVSHASNVARDRLEEIDLVPRIRHKALVTPELAPIFRGSQETLTDTFAILTAVLDGHGFIGDSGTQGRRGYVGDYLFAWLGATTPLPTQVWRVMAQLGSRLFFFQMPEADVTDEELDDALTGAPYRDRVEMCRAATGEFVRTRWREGGGVRGVKWDREQDAPGVRTRLKVLARLVSALRGITSVWWEGAGDDLGYTPPNIEEPYRALTCLYNVARGRALLYGRAALVDEDLALVTHMALSSAPQERTKLLRALVEHGGEMAQGQVIDALRVTPSMAKRAMKVLDVLGIGSLEGVQDSWQGGRLSLRSEWWPCLEVPGVPKEGRLPGLPW
jgi:hypothetical protein